jgi:hypoxanthine phosphoribosyltransferase
MKKIWYTYDDIHHVIQQLAAKIEASGQQFDAMVAIGGGGFIPARILRSFLNIPIYTVTLAYYDANDKPTDSPQKIQWIEGIAANLQGKNILVVDEVDDSRVTLEYCLNELAQAGISQLGVAVLHEKLKAKKGTLPANLPYFSGITVEDWWINYPWDALDLAAHNSEAANGNHHSEINNTNSTK